MEIEIENVNEIEIDINNQENVEIEAETQMYKNDTFHNNLKNLDYEHSGHTGFQPAGDYVTDLNYIHTDNNFTNEYKNNIDSNTSARHTHNNKSILDNISNTDINNWNNKIDKDVNNLTYYTLATNTGSTIELSINSSTYVMTLNLKNSNGSIISTGTIDLPLESMVVSGSYDDTTKKIILTLQNGNTVEFSVADLVSGLQSEITSSNKLNSDLVDDTNQTNKFVTSNEKQTWNNKSDFSGNYNDLTHKPEKFIVKEYPSFNDFPDITINYSYNTSMDYTWGPPEEYYTYSNGKWTTTITSVYAYTDNPPCIYTQEELANVTCKITGALPTDKYPDITEDSFSLEYSYGSSSSSYLDAEYCPVLTTSYGDSAHNPFTLGLYLTFTINFPPKLNDKIGFNVIYKALDTGKCYIADENTYNWVEYNETTLNLSPAMDLIDKEKQDTLVSGQNIVTINNESLLRSGNLSLVSPSTLNSYLLKSYVRNSRSTSTSGYTYDVRYINGLIKTARTTTANSTYDCTYVNGLIKTSNTSSNNYTYSCNYMNNTFLTLETLPRWDGGNQ